MSVAPTDGSGPRWFSGRRRVVLVLVAVVLATIGVVWAVRAGGAGRSMHPDLGPGPVRGVRLTESAYERDRSCRAVGADVPVVRLVEQVNVERMVLCLGPGRRAEAYPQEPYVLDASTPEGEQLLDTWAAAWSLPDRDPVPNGPCPAMAVVYPAAVITVAGVTVRPVPPYAGCFPLDDALATLGAITTAASPLP